MKICGIIAEYNPFHEGHAYQMREAKRLSGADALVVMMSGHFVQRGEPAVFDPYVRCEAALKAGADAVFMMPPVASTSSAEGFATYGVNSLYSLGCDAISCGVEMKHASQTLLSQIAKKLANEDEEMGEIIRSSMKSGMSYPAALAKAIGVEQLGPNTLLAIEYLKAIERGKLDMDFVPVERIGSGYHDAVVTEGAFPSATALRKEILSENSLEGCSDLPLGADDLLSMIVDSVRIHENELEDFADCNPAIAARLRESSLHYKTFEEMVTDIKTKDVTYTRIARVLTHILLDIRKLDLHTLDTYTYAQLIGFSNKNVLSEIKLKSAQRTGESFTIISKAADHKDILAGAARAAEVYNQALWNKYHVEGKDFFRQKILKI